MFLTAMLLTAVPTASETSVPACRAAQLRLTIDAGDGGSAGMSQDGVRLSIRNAGADCTLPALPLIRFRGARGRILAAVRRPPVGMHPGPVMVPVRLAAGHRVTSELRWVSGPVFSRSRGLRARWLVLAVGSGTIGVSVRATLFGEVGRPAVFDQAPLRAAEGMPAG